MWECRLCGSQNDVAASSCGVCGKGIYPRDAVVPGSGPVTDPGSRRGIGGVIVPGGARPPAASLPPPGTTRAVPAPSAGKGPGVGLVVLVVILVLVAVAIGIALAVGAALPWPGPGASALSMLVVPTLAGRRPGSGRRRTPGR